MSDMTVIGFVLMLASLETSYLMAASVFGVLSALVWLGFYARRQDKS